MPSHRNQRWQRRLRDPREVRRLIALTPGGRFSKDIPGCGRWRRRWSTGGYRVLLWDRPELRQVRRTVLRPERVAHARRDIARADHQTGHRAVHPRGRLRRRPRFDADHDALPRTGDQARGVEHRRRRLRLVRSRRPTTSCRASSRCGNRDRTALLQVPEWQERIAENPENRSGSWPSTDEFTELMLRWLNAFVSKPGQTIPGVEDDLFAGSRFPR